MPRGSHRSGGRIRWPLVGGIVAALAAVAVGAWFFLGGESPPEGPAGFRFELGKVGGSAVADRASEDALREGADGVRETLDHLYLVGFVDDTKWKGGTFPELFDLFTEKMRARAEKDLANLSVGADAAKIASVDPISGRLSIRFLVDDQQQLVGATARTIFSANATATDGGNVAIQHDGTYFLLPEEDRWLINGYEVEGIVTRVTQPLRDPDATPS